MAPLSRKPQAVLFACGLNSVRSPMAMGLFRQLVGPATYVASAGVRKDELDPFAVAAMEEAGIDIGKHRPMTFEDLDEWEGLNFDLIVTLAPEAHHKALELTRTLPTQKWVRDQQVLDEIEFTIPSGAFTASRARVQWQNRDRRTPLQLPDGAPSAEFPL